MGALTVEEIPESVSSLTIQPHSSMGDMKLSWDNPTHTTHGTPIDTLSNIQVSRNGENIVTLTWKAHEKFYFTDRLPRPDYYRYEICVEDTSGKMGRPLYTADMWLGGAISGIVIWELDATPITADAIEASLDSLGYTGAVYRSSTATKYPLESSLDAVFVNLGIYPNNHVLSDQEGTTLANYLMDGGNLYMEGGDTWYFDPATAVHNYFHINAIGDGSNDLYAVNGETGTPFEFFSFPYIGENSYIDEIGPTALSSRILYNPSDNLGTAVACAGDGYRTIGTSFEFGGLSDQPPTSTKKELLKTYLEFFGLITTGNGTQNTAEIPTTFTLHQNYPNPFNPATVISWQLAAESLVNLTVYTVTGQKVVTLVDQIQTAGAHKVEFDASNLASGLYLYRLKAGSFVETRKMAVMK